ncbi:MAG: hypothetical protein AAGU21_16215 [Solidesulfovibrio sp.]|uniref:hypothetical protein n=1 Tax=Solidesulfovibrio sp. TaxID=2910990 RepID=UPI002B21FCB8|nr:hypothetical protein [Solidesulfovibrio sp.]MEA4855701.1 hypothetical protein [Solidesulfovibrio sp.]
MHLSPRNGNGRGRSRAALLTTHILGGLVLAATLALAFGVVVMGLWNALMPDLFGLRPVSYWQAVGLLLLGRILIGSLGHSHSRRPRETPAWREYDAWWREAGEASFRRHRAEAARPADEK